MCKFQAMLLISLYALAKLCVHRIVSAWREFISNSNKLALKACWATLITNNMAPDVDHLLFLEIVYKPIHCKIFFKKKNYIRLCYLLTQKSNQNEELLPFYFMSGSNIVVILFCYFCVCMFLVYLFTICILKENLK